MSSESSSSSDEYEEGLSWDETLQRIKENDPRVKSVASFSRNIRDMTGVEWEELGKDIANNTHLTEVDLSYAHHLLSDREMSFLFRGLTRSRSVETLNLDVTGFGVAGVRSMMPFLQNTNSLIELYLSRNNIQSEGFNMMFRALSDSPIYRLHCSNCGIESIEIEIGHTPRHLEYLTLEDNDINADGCRELAKLLQRGDATLNLLYLQRNKIDDDGVEILVGALINNTSLTSLCLNGNDGISRHGDIMLLKLVNDISSIEATLLSNHTLECIYEVESPVEEIQQQINVATRINEKFPDEDRAGKAKVIQTQLHSMNRADLCRLQDVNHSVYNEIDPLHLPEVLSMIDKSHGQGELYIALLSSIMALFSTVNLEECIQQERAYHAAKAAEHTTKVEELDAKLAMMEEEEAARSVGVDNINHRRNRVESEESRSSKRCRE